MICCVFVFVCVFGLFFLSVCLTSVVFFDWCVRVCFVSLLCCFVYVVVCVGFA